jgi:hypothetical protein
LPASYESMVLIKRYWLMGDTACKHSTAEELG